MKRCSKCKIQKKQTFFYRDKRNPDGLKSQCKSCHTKGSLKTRNKENARRLNREYMRRARAKDIEKFRARERLAARKKIRDIKVIARSLLNRAVKKRDIAKPTICESCLEEKTITGHHEDYNKPLEVIWLCYECHGVVTVGYGV